VPVLSPDDKLFDHIDTIKRLHVEYGNQHKMRGCSLFELKLITELLSVCMDLESLQRDLANGYSISP